MSWQGIPVLVTGGLGFIGSNLVRRLVAEGAQVTVIDLDLAEYGSCPFNLADLAGAFDSIHADIGDIGRFEAQLRKAQVIFNLAGQTSHADSMSAPERDLHLNQAANLRFLEAVRQCCAKARIVYTSTRQIYGKPQYLPVDEAHPIAPPDINGIHKFAVENYHLLYTRVYGLRATALRLTNVFGPRMRIRDARQTFLGIWIRNILSGQPIEVWGGDQRRDFTYIDDLVDALLLAAASRSTEGLALNVSGNEPVTLLNLAERLVQRAGTGGYERREFPAERKKIDIGDFFGTDSAFRQATGWQPRTSLDEGLSATLEFYRRNLSHYL
jgi:UDP-glucose 4-epimerase